MEKPNTGDDLCSALFIKLHCTPHGIYTSFPNGDA